MSFTFQYSGLSTVLLNGIVCPDTRPCLLFTLQGSALPRTLETREIQGNSEFATYETSDAQMGPGDRTSHIRSARPARPLQPRLPSPCPSIAQAPKSTGQTS
jgi:hypothetical protein